MTYSIYFMADGQKAVCLPDEAPTHSTHAFVLPEGAETNSRFYELNGDTLVTRTTPLAVEAVQSKRLTAAQVQLALDSAALEHDFDNIADACSWTTSENLVWREESIAAVKLRDVVWGAFEQGAVLPEIKF